MNIIIIFLLLGLLIYILYIHFVLLKNYITVTDASSKYLPIINPMVVGSISIRDVEGSKTDSLNYYQTIKADRANLNLFSSYDGNAKIVLQLTSDPRVIVGSNRVNTSPTRSF